MMLRNYSSFFFQFSFFVKITVWPKNVNVFQTLHYTKETLTYNSVHEVFLKKIFYTYIFEPELADYSKIVFLKVFHTETM